MVDVGINIVLIAILLGRQVVLTVGSSGQEEQGKNQTSSSHRLDIIKWKNTKELIKICGGFRFNKIKKIKPTTRHKSYLWLFSHFAK